MALYVEKSELINHSTPAMIAEMSLPFPKGTGYGNKKRSHYKLKYNNRLYRVYYSCYSNCASYYILVNRKKIGLYIS